MSAAVSHAVEVTTTTCCACGVVFGLPDYLDKARRADGAAFFCPNGHSLSYGRSTVETLRTEVERQKKLVEFANNAARAERERANKLERTAERLKKRAANGVCLCCNRTFANLARHMKAKHPDVAGKARP
jgi:hypothetical protein